MLLNRRPFAADECSIDFVTRGLKWDTISFAFADSTSGIRSGLSKTSSIARFKGDTLMAISAFHFVSLNWVWFWGKHKADTSLSRVDLPLLFFPTKTLTAPVSKLAPPMLIRVILKTPLRSGSSDNSRALERPKALRAKKSTQSLPDPIRALRPSVLSQGRRTP